MTLTDQLRTILKKAGAPLSLNQIMELLPVGVDRNTVGALLSQRKRVGEFTRCVEYGKAAYAWAGVTVSEIHVAAQKPLVSPMKVPMESVKADAVDRLVPDYAKGVPKLTPQQLDDLAAANPFREPATPKQPALLTGLLEEVRDSSSRVADALYEAIHAGASKTLMAKLAIAHKALHEAHVELLGATGG
jgi:hypothetical protein